MYSIEGLKEGIVNCKRNIKVLEQAVKDERKTIADYRIMIDQLETAEAQKQEAEAGVHLEVVRDDESD